MFNFFLVDERNIDPTYHIASHKLTVRTDIYTVPSFFWLFFLSSF
jgi:hypothetical protein